MNTASTTGKQTPPTPEKVLFLGSGGQKIGPSGEFDAMSYQAIRALAHAGIRTILVSPNMTAVQTSAGTADATYFVPVTPEFVKPVIEREHPDSILASFGGRTSLSCIRMLANEGILESQGIRILGTPLETLELMSDRIGFCTRMQANGIPVPAVAQVRCFEDALTAVTQTGFPCLMRTSSANGDTASAVYNDRSSLATACAQAFSRRHTVLIEQWFGGWKEIEAVILRDATGTCVPVCLMENLDPVGIHSGESITVIPALTLSGADRERIKTVALHCAHELSIIGEASFRFAADPTSDRFILLEASSRITRSSLLASRATGYPIGTLAVQTALGVPLSKIPNPQTEAPFCQEPSFDYIAVKTPRWDMDKFGALDRHIGADIKSVGEALAFGRTFAEALQKALRMTGSGFRGLACNNFKFKDIREELAAPTDLRIFAVYEALREHWSNERIHTHAGISRHFIQCMREICDTERKLAAYKPQERIAPEDILQAKKMGFSDAQIAACTGLSEEEARALRKEYGILPSVKQIDPSAGELSAKNCSLYLTYSGIADDIVPSGKGALVLGSGPFHVGSSQEYDWCCASALKTIRTAGKTSIMINCNPEAATTDPALADRLYFEELSFERVSDIYEREQPEGVLVSMGGQIPNNLAWRLEKAHIPMFGTSGAHIDQAEDRNKFGELLDLLAIRQPAWTEASTREDAVLFAQKEGFPLLVRPSYVSSGAAMSVAWDMNSLRTVFKRAIDVHPGQPVVLSRYEENSKEIEIDAVADKGEILVYAISEHIENAGVHSGDATVVLPAQRIYLSTAKAIKKAARKIARALDITGPFNIQFLAKSEGIQVIECNLRASRSFPFCSNVFRIDLAEIAVRAQLGLPVSRIDSALLDFDHVGVRAAQFSHSRLKGTDAVPGVEMTSTGEVGCIGRGVRDAFLKAFLSAGFRIPHKKILLSTGPIEDKVDFITSARKLRAMGFELVASSGTARFLAHNGIDVQALAWPLEEKKPNIADLIRKGDIDLVINIPKNNRESELKNDFSVRALAIEYGIPLITNIKIAKQWTDSLEWFYARGVEVKSREEYS